jgi:outer membrane protein assembly factor BamD
MTRWYVRVVAVLLVAAGLAGCAARKKAPAVGAADADKHMYDRGQELLAKKNWITAREWCRRLVDSYPQSPYRAEAKLCIGDSYLGEGRVDSLILAVNEFREYMQFFPTSERADYAQYRLALAQSKQMLSAKRDQTATLDTLTEVKRFLEGYPSSEFKPEVEKIQRTARDRLSESEFLAGMVYFRGHWYPGAIARFSTILRDDPGYTRKDAVYFHLGESLLKAGAGPQALPLFERLVTEYPKSKYVKDTQKRLAVLKKPGGGRP